MGWFNHQLDLLFLVSFPLFETLVPSGYLRHEVYPHDTSNRSMEVIATSVGKLVDFTYLRDLQPIYIGLSSIYQVPWTSQYGT